MKGTDRLKFLFERDVHDLFGLAAAVEEPVVVLELDPGGGEHVQVHGGLEGVARHQLERDLARARVVQARRLLRLDPLRVDVASELAAVRAHAAHHDADRAFALLFGERTEKIVHRTAVPRFFQRIAEH